MKIGIMTFFRAHNYGAVLQAYALGRFLKLHVGQDVRFIDYLPQLAKESYSVFPKLKRTKDLLRWITLLPKYRELSIRHRGFVKFIDDNFPITKPYNSLHEINSDPPDCDAFISGSDQVFKYKSKESEAFFLGFNGSNSKISIAYAPSFGAYKILPQHKDRIRELLSQFDFLSCREASGADVIRDLTGREVPVVMDPVFLVSPHEWMEIERAPKHAIHAYILCYALVGHEKQLGIAKKIQKKTGYQIVLIGSSNPNQSGYQWVSADPQEFLFLFRNAAYIVTDSFHGTSFSILFRKNFWSVITLQIASSRITDLLLKLGLSDRALVEQDNFESTWNPIDYNKIDSLLSKHISESIEYLRSALGVSESDDK